MIRTAVPRFRLVLPREIAHSPAPMRPLVIFAISILRSARALIRSREEQAIVELAPGGARTVHPYSEADQKRTLNAL
jgi:hypothetical protein